MRLTNVLSGLAVLALTISTASAQARIYSSGGSNNQGGGAGFSGGSRAGGGAMPNRGSSGGRGMVMNAPVTNSANTNNAAPDTPRSANSTRPSQQIIWRTGGQNRDEEGRDERDFRGHRRGSLRNHYIYYPYYYPYYPGYDYPSDATDYGQQPQQTNEQYAQPEAPAPTIFENRPGYTPPPVQSYQSSTSSARQTGANESPSESSDAAKRTSAAEPQPTTILVFRDGHELEIGNYAIVGNTLYNLEGDYRTHKILLSDLDLDKTVKINEARGYQFRLPKQQAS